MAFSSSSEKGIEESIEQEPLHNTENISRENERGITSQKRQGKKNFDDGKSYQKGVVSYEELEKQTLGKLKEISRRYILTDDEKEKKLSDFVERQEKDKRKFNELWEGFVSLSNEEKKKAILRIFFFAEFWDSSQDENEGALRNIVWNTFCFKSFSFYAYV
ncbi:MAG: hypothetical protein PV347_04790 [Rickettsiaceae bacterium]|nr:hypothetical protein [Rickettsiaceae bacterium]